MLSKNHEAVVTILKYHSFLVGGAAPAKAAAAELFASNKKWLEKIRTEIKALKAEMPRRENPPLRRRV